MLSNYLKTAWRTIRRHPGYSFINVFGLAVGLAACMLVFLFVRQELNYDRFHQRSDRIFRVAMEAASPEKTSRDAASQFPMVHALRKDYPEIERATRIFIPSAGLIDVGDKSFTRERIAFSDADLFRIFTFPVLRGQAGDMLADPRSLVLSETAARRYFGTIDVIGRTLRFEKRFPFQVAAVIRDIPLLSHFHFDLFLPLSALDKDYFGFEPDLQWGGIMNNYTYCLLNGHASAPVLERKMKDIVDRNAPRRYEVRWTPILQPLLDIHLHSHLGGEIETPGHPVILITLSLIAAFILLIAAINFINLSTARSVRRAREVGLRKVLGAGHGQLIKQFLGETFFLSAAAMALAAGIGFVALPGFSLLVGHPVGLTPGGWPSLLGFMAALVLLVGLLAGLYPAFSLSKRSPIGAFKAAQADPGWNSSPLRMRRALVVFQFFISIALIVGTLTVLKQLRYFASADLGFNRGAVVNIPIGEDALKERTDSLKAELLKLPGVKGATACLKSPMASTTVGTGFYASESDKDRFDVDMNFIDTDYVREFGLRLVAGKNLGVLPSAEMDFEILLNETAVRKMGYARPEDILGKKLRTGLWGRKGSVVGVVADFHAYSLQEEIPSSAMVFWPRMVSNLAVRLHGEKVRETLAAIEKIWRSFSAYPFDYTFLNDDIRGFYQEERRILAIVTTFAGLAVVLACLGLLGLSAFTAQQRTKEIGIRKVLGASLGGIVGILSKEFLACVLVANILAWPLAYLSAKRWLENFAYRTSPDAGTFVLAGLLALAFAALTIGLQTVRAARADPVDSLRYE
ncbi:MAG: ABC transporter permease [Candidatus Aminicenantes bacterium]|nr:ABC transporter permease [Candidatus Aminicenantes bacterium]